MCLEENGLAIPVLPPSGGGSPVDQKSKECLRMKSFRENISEF